MSTIPHEKRWTLDYPQLGTGLVPIEPYVSADYFNLECEKIFKHTWLNVGRVEEIPKAGDYFVRDLAVTKTSILVVRDKDGVVRGFHNVCVHRGTKLVWDDCGSCQTFACKYHGWSYAPDGQLIGVPEEDMFFDFDKSEIKLSAVATDVWEGFIFINLDPNPHETLREYVGDLADLFAGFPFDQLPVCYSYQADLRCNWKVVVDSQQEGYHAKMLHRRSLPGFLTNKEHPTRHVVHMDLFKRHRLISYFGNRNRTPAQVEGLAYQFGTSVANFVKEFSGENMPKGMNPTRDPNWAFDEYVIFPNFHVLLFFGMYITHNIWPIDVDHCIWEARAYLPAAKNASEWFSQEYSKCLLRDAWLEDGSTLEASQVGLESGAMTHFILQDQELMIRHFQKVLEDYIGA